MRKIQINKVPHQVDERFENYEFYKKPSSNVNIFGFTPPLHPDHADIYTVIIQFNNGGTYTYDGVSHDTIMGAIECESIGKYYRAEISGKYPGVKLEGQAVTRMEEECTN